MFRYSVIITIFIYQYASATLDIVFKRFEMCEDHKDTPMQYWTTFTKINSTVSLANGKAILPYAIGDDVKIDTVIEMFRSDKWNEVYTLKSKPLCELLNKYGGDLWKETGKRFDMTDPCPIPKGTYELKDFVVDFTLLPIKVAPKALLRSTAHLMKEEELLLCFYSEYEIL